MAPKSRGGSGKLSRRSALALVAGGSILSLTGSGAFSQVDANRSFGVSTAEDDEALLTLDLKLPHTEGSGIEIKDKSGGSIGKVNIKIVNNPNNFQLKLDRNGRASQSIEIRDFESPATFYIESDDSSGCLGKSGSSSSNSNGCPDKSGSSSGNSNGNDSNIPGEIEITASGPEIKIVLERKIKLKKQSDSGGEEKEESEESEEGEEGEENEESEEGEENEENEENEESEEGEEGEEEDD